LEIASTAGPPRETAPVAEMSREKDVYFAKLAEQAERYDEMATHMEAVGKTGGELSVEERNLLSVAYKNAVGSRRAAWRIITSVEQKETSKGNEENAKFAKEYCKKVEAELDDICQKILSVLEHNLIGKATTGESKVFYSLDGGALRRTSYGLQDGVAGGTPHVRNSIAPTGAS